MDEEFSGQLFCDLCFDRNRDTEGNRKSPALGFARANALEEWLDRLLASDLVCLDQDVITARIVGQMISTPALKSLWVPDAKSKKPKFGQDLQIAAASIRHQIPIATENISDFLRIHQCYKLPGLCNPATGEWYAGSKKQK